MMLSWRKEAGIRRLGWMAAIFFGVILFLLLYRYFTYYASYDQGIFNQVFWNNAQGRFFQSTLSSQLSTNVVHSGEFPRVDYHRLGQHFTPALLFWLPLYTVFPSPVTLCILQATFATIAGILLYALARKYLEVRLSLAIVFSFYCAIAVVNPMLANFHDFSQIPMFLFALLLAMEYRRWFLFALLCVAIVLVREDSAITLFGVGAYLLASRRHPRIGLSVCIFSVGYFYLVTNVFMPIFSEDISQRFMIEKFGQFVDHQAASTLDVIWTMIRQPGLTLRELFSPPGDTALYFIEHWLPLAFVPALSPATWILTAPPLLQLLLSEGSGGLNASIRYALSIVPGMFYGAVLWWAGQGVRRFFQPLSTLPERSPNRPFRRFWGFCLVICLVAIPFCNPSRAFYFIVPDSFQPWVYVSPLTQWQRTAQMNALVAKIPLDASVTASTYIVPHVSGRRSVLRMPTVTFINDEGQNQDVDYILADLWMSRRYQVASKRDRREFGNFIAAIQEWIAQGKYGLIDARDGIVLLQRNTPSVPAALANWEDFFQEL